MALGRFGGTGKGEDVGALIAKKNYSKAIEVIRENAHLVAAAGGDASLWQDRIRPHRGQQLVACGLRADVTLRHRPEIRGGVRLGAEEEGFVEDLGITDVVDQVRVAHGQNHSVTLLYSQV